MITIMAQLPSEILQKYQTQKYSSPQAGSSAYNMSKAHLRLGREII